MSVIWQLGFTLTLKQMSCFQLLAYSGGGHRGVTAAGRSACLIREHLSLTLPGVLVSPPGIEPGTLCLLGKRS